MRTRAREWIGEYFMRQEEVLRSVSRDALSRVVELLETTRKAGRQIFVAGNGGSASNASHFAQDLTKGASDALVKAGRTPFQCLSLTDNVSWITALANDYSYEDIFVEQLKKLAGKGDVFIGISVSGTSKNVVKAAEMSSNADIHVVSLIGDIANPSGKPHLRDFSDIVIEVASPHFGRVEDAQMTCLHALAYHFQENAGDI